MLNARAIYRLLIDDVPPAIPAEPAPSVTPAAPEDTLDVKSELLRYAAEPFNVPGTGPTDLFHELHTKLHGRTSKKIANNTYVIDYRDRLAVRFHQTDVVTAYPDGRIKIDTGGWHTNTSRDRINDNLDSGWGIYQLKGRWYWYNCVTGDGTRWGIERGAQDRLLPYTDGDCITAAGALKMQAHPEYPKRRRRRRA